MASADALKAKIEACEALQPVTHCEVEDTTGGGACGSKFAALVVSAKFEGVALLDRHRMVQAALADEMKLIHALQIKAWTPTVYEQKKAAGAAPSG